MRTETKITTVCVGSLLLTAVVFVTTALWKGQQFGAQAQTEVSSLVDADMNHITRAAFDLVKSQDESIRNQVNHALLVADDQFRRVGGVKSEGSAVRWKAVNQLTGQAVGLTLPRMMVGRVWLGANARKDQESVLVDDISRLTGSAVTIFQRVNAQGDMLRVSTNVQTKDGRRAIGTFIPAVNPGGAQNPLVATVLRGETYYGNAYVVNAWYVSAYRPIRDAGGSVVGALFVGYRQQSLPTLCQAIRETRVGHTGSLAVMGAAGSIQGNYLISGDRGQEGHNAWNDRDAEGSLFARDLARKARALRPGQIASARYRVGEPGTAPRWKVYRFAFYAPWNWVLVTCADEEEFLAFNARLRAGQTRMIHLFAGEALFMACVCGLFCLWAKIVAARLEQMGQETRKTLELQSDNDSLEQVVAERTRQMEHQAFHDALTDLPNRALFRNRLDFALTRRQRQAAPLAVIFIDLDNFKFVNDSLGHDAGDQMLVEIARRLSVCLELGDTVARLGGDEFVLLLEHINCAQDALDVGERILRSWQQPLELKGKEHLATGSIGVAFSADGRSTSEALMRDADTAMYHAKSQGKAGCVLFHPDMYQDIREKMEIENGLRVALEHEELRVCYQPLIDLRTGRLIGAEALMRWQHPQRGLLAPGHFIAIAESVGLIVPMGYWILEQACRQTCVWAESFSLDSQFTISVNLSGRQLQRDDVVERVEEALRKTGLPPHHLKLEITESVMMEDVEGAVVKLRRLKALGVMLALDDFGTGYSSMASLSSFPIDTVKIDKTFVQRMNSDEDAASVIAAMISLSKALRLDVTGEGIETQEHLTQLQSLGCDIGQGYYFAQPLTTMQMAEPIRAIDAPFVALLDRDSLAKIEAMLRAA